MHSYLLRYECDWRCLVLLPTKISNQISVGRNKSGNRGQVRPSSFLMRIDRRDVTMVSYGLVWYTNYSLEEREVQVGTNFGQQQKQKKHLSFFSR
jgi:hypothetical protein